MSAAVYVTWCKCHVNTPGLSRNLPKPTVFQRQQDEYIFIYIFTSGRDVMYVHKLRLTKLSNPAGKGI